MRPIAHCSLGIAHCPFGAVSRLIRCWMNRLSRARGSGALSKTLRTRSDLAPTEPAINAK
jgi:hypothetical protein